MNASTPPTSIDPGISALQSFIIAERQHAKGVPEHAPEVQNLALQIAHNLRFQQGWTDLHVHFRVSSEGRRGSAAALPRPVISGLPPQRLYVHPDEQIEVLQQQRREGKAGWPDLATEREWVLPSQLRESWSLRRFADVFDALSIVPTRGDGRELFNLPGGVQADGSSSSGSVSRSESEGSSSEQEPNPWRMKHPKRLLLATLDDDSSVVYYIVHDGIVKPRQN